MWLVIQDMSALHGRGASASTNGVGPPNRDAR